MEQLPLVPCGRSVDRGQGLQDRAPSSPGPAPDSFRVAFETTRGSFVAQVNRAWAPHGADRFYALVENQFFDGDPFFRVVPGFIAQFGLNLNRKINEQWDEPRIPDDSVRQSDLRGTLTFAAEGANSRNHQLFFNLADKNARLDRTGFAPIASNNPGRIVPSRNRHVWRNVMGTVREDERRSPPGGLQRGSNPSLHQTCSKRIARPVQRSLQSRP